MQHIVSKVGAGLISLSLFTIGSGCAPVTPSTELKAERARITPAEIIAKIDRGETFVVNLDAAWCPDCREQSTNLTQFANDLKSSGLELFTLQVQKEKGVFLSNDHQRLAELLGESVIKAEGRVRFPLTVLVVKGKIKQAEFEIMSEDNLKKLAEQFISKMN